MGAQSEYKAQLVNGEINVGIVVENVCHPLQAEGHMAGQVGGRKVTWHRCRVPQPLSKIIGCQTSVQCFGPNVVSHNKTILLPIQSSYNHF